MAITTFSVGTRVYRFKEPLTLKRESVEGWLYLTHEDLGLFARGSSWSECDEIIREDLATLWEEYALAPDEELTAGATALKNKLLAMVVEL